MHKLILIQVETITVHQAKAFVIFRCPFGAVGLPVSFIFKPLIAQKPVKIAHLSGKHPFRAGVVNRQFRTFASQWCQNIGNVIQILKIFKAFFVAITANFQHLFFKVINGVVG